MNNNLKPIPTKYKGKKFRSRLEARYAVYLYHLGWTWEYEPEGFLLPTLPYLPDFYIRGLNCFIEVKPEPLNEQEMTKVKELSLAMNTGEHSIDVLLFEGQPDYKSFRTISNGQVFIDVVAVHANGKFYPYFCTSAFDPSYFHLESLAFDMAKEATFEFKNPLIHGGTK